MSKHVLLIDDDEDDALFFSDALKELEIHAVVDHFDNGKTALKTLQENKGHLPDAIFLDINMPNINGWECLRQIKALAFLQKTPIIMYSTSNLEGEGLTASDVGATAFLTKPHHFEELKTLLSNLFKEIW